MNLEWSSIKTPYTDDNVEGQAPTKAGVYILCVKIINGKWRCFYVGQTNDLDKRLKAHLSWEEPNEKIKEKVTKYICGYAFAPVPLKSDRDGIESFLYDYYKPECNFDIPLAEPIETNLP